MLAFLDHFAQRARDRLPLDFASVADYDAFLSDTVRLARAAKPRRLPVVRRPRDDATLFFDDLLHLADNV